MVSVALEALQYLWEVFKLVCSLSATKGQIPAMQHPLAAPEGALTSVTTVLLNYSRNSES